MSLGLGRSAVDKAIDNWFLRMLFRPIVTQWKIKDPLPTNQKQKTPWKKSAIPGINRPLPNKQRSCNGQQTKSRSSNTNCQLKVKSLQRILSNFGSLSKVNLDHFIYLGWFLLILDDFYCFRIPSHVTFVTCVQFCMVSKCWIRYSCNIKNCYKNSKFLHIFECWMNEWQANMDVELVNAIPRFVS